MHPLHPERGSYLSSTHLLSVGKPTCCFFFSHLLSSPLGRVKSSHAFLEHLSFLECYKSSIFLLYICCFSKKEKPGAVGKRPEDAYSDQGVAAEAFGSMNLAMPPGPAAGNGPSPPTTGHVRERSLQRVVGTVGGEVGGGNILAMGEKVRKLQLTFTKGLASLCLPTEGQDDMPASS